MTRKLSKKVLLIGWDAADWKVIHPLMDAGLLPNVEKLVNDGVMGRLATMDPPYSPMLWSSIATGKRAYQHGVLGFNEPAPNGKSVRPVRSTSRQVKAIWNMLSQKQMKTHVAGWWPSHPAEQINGVFISNLYQLHKGTVHEPWPLAEGTVHPAEYSDHFAQFRVHPDELTGEHLLPFVPEAAKIDQSKDQRLRSVATITAHCSSLHAAFTHVLRTQQWDFAAIYLDAIDHYCHGFMKYHPPKRDHIPQDEFDLYKDVVTAGYRYHDMMLGRLMEMAGEETTIMLISDHGFQPDHLRPRNIPKEPAGPAYEHSPYGIICMKGPGIKKDEQIFGASVLDITPTLLTLFDLPVGEDMDGKVLLNAFDQTVEIKTIPSWEKVPGECGMPVELENSSSEQENLMNEQLEALGYIEKRTGNKEQQIKATVDECNVNLARAYIDGGEIDRGIPLLEQLHEENPETARYAFRLASCYQAMGRLKDCRKIIGHLRGLDLYNDTILDVMEGSLLIGERQPRKALQLFKTAEEKVDPNQSRLSMQIAQCYLMLKRYEDAERNLKKEIVLDPDNAQALQMLGMLYLNTQEYGPAAEALLAAVGLEYEMPVAHHYLGRALVSLGKYAEAVNALEVSLTMLPQNNQAREQLAHLYEKYLNQPEKAQLHREDYLDKIQGTITIVSGLPRSGTSMMMQMLEKGGLELFTDEHRAADDNNPRGYYEHEAVKSLPRNRNWVPLAKDKGVKVIANLLPYLPKNFHYKIIFMERDLHEIIASQKRMLSRLGKKTKADVLSLKLYKSYEQTLQKTQEWAVRLPNVEILNIQHREVIQSPFAQALQINEFLEYSLLPELMAEAVDSKLHREKSSKSIVEKEIKTT